MIRFDVHNTQVTRNHEPIYWVLDDGAVCAAILTTRGPGSQPVNIAEHHSINADYNYLESNNLSGRTWIMERVFDDQT